MSRTPHSCMRPVEGRSPRSSLRTGSAPMVAAVMVVRTVQAVEAPPAATVATVVTVVHHLCRITVRHRERHLTKRADKCTSDASDVQPTHMSPMSLAGPLTMRPLTVVERDFDESRMQAPSGKGLDRGKARRRTPILYADGSEPLLQCI